MVEVSLFWILIWHIFGDTGLIRLFLKKILDVVFRAVQLLCPPSAGWYYSIFQFSFVWENRVNFHWKPCEDAIVFSLVVIRSE